MDPGDDSQSFFAAARPQKGNGIDETLNELKQMQQNLLANRSNQGSPSRGAMLQPNSNVIIPSTGAANYWYVDPKAELTRSFNPMQYAAPTMPSGPRALNPAQSMEIQNAKIGQLYGRRPSPVESGPQDRPSGYDEMMQEPGIVSAPTMDLEGGAQGTGIYEIDGKFHVLPTQVNGVKFDGDAAVQRFQKTGEHLGVFNAEDDASIFEAKYLKDLGDQQQRQFQLLPKNTPNILMKSYLGNAPRFADDRGDLLRDTENTFYGGGHAPPPSPTPTPPKYFPVSYFT